jgi:GTPase SAR1 family protein
VTDYDSLRQATLSLFPEIIGIAKRATASETERRLVVAQAALEDSSLLTVVCGEFKRGKSSLLNALLDEPELLPVDDYYATSLVTSVAYGEQERIVVRLAKNGKPEERPIGREELADYVTEGGNPGNGKGVQAVAIEIPSQRLASGLVLVDTPGVGGVYAAHAEATTAAIPGASAIVFVTDATQPLTESELHFLRRTAETAKVLEDEDALLFVLTKIDLVSDFDAILANTRRKLADITGRQESSVTVVPVSSRAKLEFLAGGDEADLLMSNFGELEHLIWGALTRRRAKVILGSALSALELSRQALLRPIEDEVEALNGRGAKREAELRDARQRRQRRLDELKAGDAAWRRDLARGVKRMSRDVQAIALAEVDNVWHRLRAEYLHNDDLLYNTDRLVNRLVDDMVTVVGTANRLLEDRAAGLQRDFAARNHLDLEHAAIGQLPDPPVSDIRVTGDLGAAERPSSALRNWRDISTGSTAGGTGGAVIGGLIGTFLIPVPGLGTWIGAAIGGALGGVVGGAFGLRTSAKAVRQQERDARRRSLQLTLEPFYREQRTHIGTSVEDVAEDFTDAITAELDSRIAAERESVAESERRAQEASRHSAAQAQARQTELDGERVPLDVLRGQITLLAEAAAALATKQDAADGGAA